MNSQKLARMLCSTSLTAAAFFMLPTSAGAQVVCTDANTASASGTASKGGDVACGPGAAAADGASVAVGNNAKANGGSSASPTVNASSIAIGNGATASGDRSVAIGGASNATGLRNVAIGPQAQASLQFDSALGYNASASGGRSTSLGSNTKASGASSLSAGDTSSASAASTIALGDHASAAASGGTAIGKTALSSGSSSLAIGNTAQATAASDTALGDHASATGGSSFAAGDTASADGAAAVAVGLNSSASGENSLALGNGSVASGADSIAIGTGNTVSGQGSGAIGDPTTITGSGSYSIGNNNTIDADNAFVLGNNVAVPTGMNGSVVLGDSSAATAAVATSSVTVNGTTFTGFAGAAPTSTVSVGAAGAERQITNVAAGRISVTSTDAINGSQLFSALNQLTAASAGVVLRAPTANTVALTDPTGTGAAPGAPQRLTNLATGSTAAASTDAVNGGQVNTAMSSAASAFGGGSIYNATTGALTGPTYNVAGGTHHDVGSALAAMDGQLTTVAATAANSVQYDDAGKSAVTLGGAGSTTPVALVNVKAGTLSATSTDAVNGAQLFATNQQVASLTTNVANGAVGVVQRTGTAGTVALTDPTGTGAAPGAPQKLTNLGAATLSATSTDAVNGSQLYATNQTANKANSGLAEATSSLGGGASYNPVTGVYTGPTYNVAGGAQHDVGSALAALDGQIAGVSTLAANAVQYNSAAKDSVTLGGTGATTQVALTNVKAGSLSATSSDAVNGSQLYETNQQVAALSNGTAGLVQQVGGSPSNGTITIGAKAGGTIVDVGGTQGPRRITGIASGQVAAGSTDAVNGGQIYAMQIAWDRRFADVNFDLSDVRTRMDSGLAGVAAMGALPQSVNPGRVVIGMGSSIRDGQAALAVGLSGRSSDDRFVFNLRAGFDKKVTVAVGAGIEF